MISLRHSLPSQSKDSKSNIAALQTLPNETWLQILGYCSKRDLKVLRLTSKKDFEILASALLFTTAYVAARRGVLDIFIKLTTVSYNYALLSLL
jgi:hypothetical protein